MLNLLAQLWHDDFGAILATEYTLVSGVVVAGVVPGLVAVRDSVNASMTQTAGMVQAFAPQFTYSGFRTPVAAVPGLQSPAMAQPPAYGFSQPQQIAIPQWNGVSYPAP